VVLFDRFERSDTGIIFPRIVRIASVSHGNELALIDWIRQQAISADGLQVGIGDDAAVWQVGGKSLLLTADMLMEGVDFLVAEASATLIGRKAMAVNLSDIAAMAGRPLVALVAVALPKNRGFEFARELHQGMQSLADEFGVAIIGGDTNIWDKPLVVTVTIIGEATDRGPVRRSGAKPGDWLFVTGPLGGSIRGQHLSFTPRIHEAIELHKLVDLHAMIDLSDGLSADLYHMLDESRVGATLFAETIPIAAAAQQMNDDRSPLEHALNDGEDFELLFSVSADDGRKLVAEKNAVPTFHIGEVDANLGARLRLNDESTASLIRAGWEHSF
jgi:thiamine-monophosphate kinase